MNSIYMQMPIKREKKAMFMKWVYWKILSNNMTQRMAIHNNPILLWFQYIFVIE